MSEQNSKPAASVSSIRKQTEISELLSDLGAGVLEQQINRALSDVALGAVTHNKKGEVVLKFVIKPVGSSGTQVNIDHSLKFVKPTARGKVIEDVATDTPLHVGAGGRLTIFPENQGELGFTRDRS